MKKLVTLITAFTISIFVIAQDDYKKTMLENIQALDTIGDAKMLNNLAATFTAIYDVKKEWQPLYYECLCYIKLSETYTNTDDRKTAIIKAETLLNNLPEENDEVQVLRALYAMNYLSIDRSLWQTYLPMMNAALKKAQGINADNPRIYYLQGILKYNMPASMGGGHEEGIKLFQQSLQKFENYKPIDNLTPNWGRKELEKFIQFLFSIKHSA